ncbi:S-type pyocin domain-containing protein [Hafnia alvei]|uniref:S-type pyocin domain-containing protein n=1 Tax=Hafnia alvei TaxID=569 RepID=UPI000B6B6A1A
MEPRQARARYSFEYGASDSPNCPSSITVLQIPEKVGSDIKSYPAPTVGDFEDYILIFLGTDMPPTYIYLSKNGAPRAMFKPTGKMAYWNDQ